MIFTIIMFLIILIVLPYILLTLYANNINHGEEEVDEFEFDGINWYEEAARRQSENDLLDISEFEKNKNL